MFSFDLMPCFLPSNGLTAGDSISSATGGGDNDGDVADRISGAIGLKLSSILTRKAAEKSKREEEERRRLEAEEMRLRNDKVAYDKRAMVVAKYIAIQAAQKAAQEEKERKRYRRDHLGKAKKGSRRVHREETFRYY